MPHSARERLTSTAIRLFTARGLSQVGINEIIREADVARMSLYNHFGSKEELALAAYKALSKARHDAIDAAISSAPNPRQAILSIFDAAEALAREPAFRGCAFINLAAHTASPECALAALVREHKVSLRRRFERLAAEDGHSDPAMLGRQLLALWDGALVDSFVEGDLGPIAAARAAADELLAGRARNGA